MSPRPAEIELVNVTRRFGNTVATRDLSFAVAPGEIVALVGRTGAGKSTAMNLIMGTIGPDTGTGFRAAARQARGQLPDRPAAAVAHRRREHCAWPADTARRQRPNS
jgi:ABC-type sugar transport system ATPase subunit